MDNKPKVSIIMPAYNAEKTINEAIDSVLLQTYKNFELIVINDCSTDSTALILHHYSKEDSRVHIINNKENSGVSFSRNVGVAYASGYFIAFLDSDDMWRYDKLEKQVFLMLEKNAVLSYTASAFIDGDGGKSNYILSAEEKTTYKTLLRKNLVSCSSAMVRSTIMKQIKMPSDKMHEDYYVWLTILKKEKYAYGLDEPLLIYRMSKNSKSSNRFKSARMSYNTYHAVGYNKVFSFMLTMRYAIHSITKRYKIKNERGIK